MAARVQALGQHREDPGPSQLPWPGKASRSDLSTCPDGARMGLPHRAPGSRHPSLGGHVN